MWNFPRILESADLESSMPTAEDTLLPGREVKLSTGKRVRIEPWSLRVGRRVLEPVNDLLQISVSNPDAKIPQLIDLAFDEVMQIVQVTVGFDDEQMENLRLEDAIELATVTLEVCLVREDGGGLMGKMMRFGKQGGNLLLAAALGPEEAAAVMAEANRSEKPQRSKKRGGKKSGRSQTHSS